LTSLEILIPGESRAIVAGMHWKHLLPPLSPECSGDMIGNYRILVLDDDVAFGDLLKAFLETSGPFSVEQIIMGSDLLGRLGSNTYHLFAA